MTPRRLWNIARFAGSCGAELVVDAVFVVDADDTARRTNLTPKCRATGGSTMGRSRRFSITTRAIPKERGVHSAVAAGGAVAAFGVRRLQAPLSRVARVAFDRLGHRFPTFDSFVIPVECWNQEKPSWALRGRNPTKDLLVAVAPKCIQPLAGLLSVIARRLGGSYYRVRICGEDCRRALAEIRLRPQASRLRNRV